MSVYRLLDEVKRALRPDERVIAVRDAVIADINAALEREGLFAYAVPGGSVAKRTFLAGDHDIDIFVRFSPEYDDDVLSDLLEEALEGFGAERLHGSRDYFQFSWQGYDIEVIPVLNVEHAGQARNVTDMSPLHVSYFAERGEGLEDEVRLAKQFCKAAGVYGAESYIRGFSGHVIDLLIMHYRSFYALVKDAASWKEPVVIDLESHHEDALRALDPVKHSPLIIVDPVQPDRNAAAALGRESFDAFIAASKAFLRDPSEEFFIIRSFDEPSLRKELAEHPGAAVLVSVRAKEDDKRDVAGARIRKAFERLRSALERSGFTLVEDGWHFREDGDSLVWFVTQEHSLPRLEEREGPPVSASVDAERFRAAHAQVEERGGRLYAKAERALRTARAVVEDLSAHLHEHVHVTIVRVEEVPDAPAPAP